MALICILFSKKRLARCNFSTFRTLLTRRTQRARSQRAESGPPPRAFQVQETQVLAQYGCVRCRALVRTSISLFSLVFFPALASVCLVMVLSPLARLALARRGKDGGSAVALDKKEHIANSVWIASFDLVLTFLSKNRKTGLHIDATAGKPCIENPRVCWRTGKSPHKRLDFRVLI